MRFATGIGPGQRHDVLLAQDRGLAFDQEARALVPVGDDAVTQDEALIRLEFDFQRHGQTSPLPSMVADDG
jgi:hypothetical protein